MCRQSALFFFSPPRYCTLNQEREKQTKPKPKTKTTPKQQQSVKIASSNQQQNNRCHTSRKKKKKNRVGDYRKGIPRPAFESPRGQSLREKEEVTQPDERTKERNLPIRGHESRLIFPMPNCPSPSLSLSSYIYIFSGHTGVHAKVRWF